MQRHAPGVTAILLLDDLDLLEAARCVRLYDGVGTLAVVPRSADVAERQEQEAGDRLLMVFAIAVGLGSGYCVRRLVGSDAMGASVSFVIVGSFLRRIGHGPAYERRGQAVACGDRRFRRRCHRRVVAGPSSNPAGRRRRVAPVGGRQHVVTIGSFPSRLGR